MNARLLILIAVAATACDSKVPEGKASSATPPALRGATLVPARGKPQFTLTSMNGGEYDFRRETDGKATLLFFGYTNCPDVCPTHMANIGAAYKQLSASQRQRLRVIFVTTDPQRDTPERLRQWLANFDKDFIGLTGPLDRVNAIQATVMMPPASRQATTDGSIGGYGIAHGAGVLAFTPDDSLRAVYLSGIQQQDWARDLPLLINYPRAR